MTDPDVGTWYPRSFVLTDIVDSVSLWERDADQMAQAVARHDAIISREVAAAGGTLVRSKGEGDSTFSVFDHPADAVTAAAAIQAAIEAEEWPTAERLRVRAGVHTGDAEPRDGDWYGPAVNRSARLRALADRGQTLLSGVTAGLVAEQMHNNTRLLYRGRRALRGIERPEEVWELVAVDDPRLAIATTRSVRVGNFPVELTRFVGRIADLGDLADIVGYEPLVTLTGPGGSGKTRLALEVARTVYARGGRVWLAELASLRDAGLVAGVVANAVGVETGQNPLVDLLAQADTLAGVLVLDNCEHLLDACRVLTKRLLAAAPGIQVLATSREPLRLVGEREWPVRPLDVPHETLRDHEELVRVESVQLLLDRARAVRPRLNVGRDDVASVVGICRALDGVPLAIELAASRLRSLGFADLEARLSDQLAVLAMPAAIDQDDARHRTLRMTFDWSYDLLTDQQKALARRLSVFAGGFRLDAAEAVCGGDLDVLDGVDELVAKSLVTFDGTTARYRLLEPLRQYLAERLNEAGGTESVERAHAEWVARLCYRLGTRLLEDQRTRSRRLGEEAGNIDLALRWAHDRDRAMANQIVGSLGQYWMYYDQASGRRWSEASIEAGADIPPRSRAKALLSAGMLAQNDHAWDRSITRLRDALAIYRAEDSAAGKAASLFWLGRALANRPDPVRSQDDATEATECFEEALQLCIQLGDWHGTGWCRIWLSAHAFWNEDWARSEELAKQVINECSAAGVRHPVGQALCNLGFIAHRRGDDNAALAFLLDAVAVYRDLDDRWQLAGLLVDLVVQEVAVGRAAEGLQALAESVRLDDEIGRLPGRAFRLAVAAVVHLARGQRPIAIAAMGAYLAHPTGPRGWGQVFTGSDKVDVVPWLAGGYLGWIADAVNATRAQLDPAEVAAATAAARHKSIDELIDELIIHPANASM